MPTVDFGSGYRDATKGATLKALQLRRQEAAEAQAQAMQPRQIASPWQGAAQIAETIGGGIREGRAAADEQAGRQRLAELLAGGISPEEMGEATILDPDLAMKHQERAWTQEDTAATRAENERIAQRGHGWDVQAAVDRVTAESASREDTQAASVDLQNQRLEAERKAAELEAAGEIEAANIEHDRARELQIMEDQAAAKTAGIEEINTRERDRIKAAAEAAEPETGTGKAIEEYNRGAYGEVGSPEAKARLAAEENKATAVTSGITINAGEMDSRRALAAELGFEKGTPEYNQILANGKLSAPASDRATVNEQKEIMDAEDVVASTDQTIKTLSSVISGPEGQTLNDRAGSGWTAGLQAALARNDPTGFFDDAEGEATTELQTKVMTNAYASLKAIFGANPTEGERKALDGLQASIDKSPNERRTAIQFAIEQAEIRNKINRMRSEQLRSGTFFKPGGGSSAGGTSAGGGGGKPASIPQEEWDNMPDEDKALFQ